MEIDESTSKAMAITGIASHPYGLTKNKQPRRPPSVVWYYFDKIPEEPQRARCKLCGTSCHHANNTSNLFKHLQKKHPTTYREAESQRDAEMELYQEVKAKFVKPLVRPGVRGRRPKALTQRLIAEGIIASPSKDIKPIIGAGGTVTSPPAVKRNFMVNPEKARGNMNKALMKFLAVDLMPPSVVEGKGFRELVQSLNLGFDVPRKKNLSKSMLTDFAETTKIKVKQDVISASFLSLSADSWIHRGHQQYVTITAHFIKDNWEMSSVVLDTFDRTPETTGEALASKIKSVTDEWGISDRITCLVSDGEDATVTAATLSSGWDHLICFGHTLNTAISAALASLPEVIRVQQKTSEAVTYFEMNSKAADTLAAVQQQHNIPMHKLKQEKPQLWLSTFKMFVRMVEQFEAVNTVLCFLAKDHMCLCDDEVDLMRQVVEVLRPFQAATEEICNGQSGYPCVSKVIPLSTLLQQVTVNTDQVSGQLRAALVQEMQLRFSHYQNCYHLAVATLLDPRFKRHAFTDLEALQTAQNRLIGELTQTVQNTESTDNMSSQSSSSNSESTSSFWNMFDRKVSEAGALRNTASEAENESRRYFQEANVPRTSDPLRWWKLNVVQFPHLKILAHKFLCVPATATTSQRLFSIGKDEVDRRRNGLQPSLINNVLFLNKNADTHK